MDKGTERKKVYKIVCGDALELLSGVGGVQTVFMDPPDNLGLGYDGFDDRREGYYEWLEQVVRGGCGAGNVVWLSYYWKHDFKVKRFAVWEELERRGWDLRTVIWRFTFGQYREKDMGNGYRPIIRAVRPGVAIQKVGVVSWRAANGDSRAAGREKMVDDVWEIPRVVGRERRAWHPTQHPQALVSRCLRMAGPGLVVDPFGGTGTTMRVARELGYPCVIGDQSLRYCRKMAEDMPWADFKI